MPARLLRRLVPLAALALGPAACFLGYDSRWGQQRAAQQHNAAHAAPATLSAEGDAPPAELRPLRVRFYVTQRYAAQTVGADRRIEELVADANKVLGPSVGVKLETERVRVWEAAVREDVLSSALEDLHAADDGKGVELVVALIGALPAVSSAFHEAGMATVLGRHVVLRAASRLGEREAIDQAFGSLGEEERAKLANDRRRHRATAIFLHEIGHALGAMHETDPDSLMYPEYRRGMTGYSREAASLMRVTVAHADDPRTRDARAKLAEELLAQLDATPSAHWSDGEAAAMRSRLHGWVTRADPPAPSAPPAPQADPFAALSEADRETARRAVEAQRGGDVERAWSTAKPLFASYPSVYALQDLRCQLAMRRGLPFDVVRRECEVLMQLSVPPTRP